MDGDGGGALLGEGAGLVDEFLGEVEGDEVVVTHFPETEGNAASAAAGFEQAGSAVREKALDQQPLRFPEPKGVRGASVMDDGDRVVEVVADGGRGDFLGGGQRENSNR